MSYGDLSLCVSKRFAAQLEHAIRVAALVSATMPPIEND